MNSIPPWAYRTPESERRARKLLLTVCWDATARPRVRCPRADIRWIRVWRNRRQARDRRHRCCREVRLSTRAEGRSRRSPCRLPNCRGGPRRTEPTPRPSMRLWACYAAVWSSPRACVRRRAARSRVRQTGRRPRQRAGRWLASQLPDLLGVEVECHRLVATVGFDAKADCHLGAIAEFAVQRSWLPGANRL